MTRDTPRRAVLAGLIALPVATTVLARPDWSPVDLKALCAFACRARDVADLGRAILRHRPNWTSESCLAALLGRLPSDALVDRGTLVDALRKASRDDFAAGRVVTVAGWRISETEGRILALGAA